MSSEKSVTPQIRFKGFTEAWEQRELGDIAEIIGGGTPDTNNPSYWDGDIDWYSPAELGEQIYAIGSRRRITKEGYKNSSAKLLPANKTILFTSRAGIGTTAILCRSACTNQGFQSLVINDNTDLYFIYSMSSRIKDFAISKASGSTFLEISGKQLATMNLFLPQLNEQRKIGQYFKSLDNLITLHQRKLDVLKKIKSALLEKMFPKDGSDIPEIRFTGFTEAWEQRKFSDLTDEVTEKTITEDEDILLSCAITGIYTNSEYFSHFRGRSNIGYLKVKRNMLILSAQNLHLGNANVNLKFDHGIISPAYKTFDLKNWNPVFANAWIKRPRANKFWDNATTAGASLCRKNIVWKDLAEQIIYIPTIEKEQCQIGSIFELFDNLITLHQRKLNALKKIKSALLEKMFV